MGFKSIHHPATNFYILEFTSSGLSESFKPILKECNSTCVNGTLSEMLTSATSASFREVVFKGGSPILGHTKSSPGQGYAGRKSKWESAADPLSKSFLLCRECCPRLDGMIALSPPVSSQWSFSLFAEETPTSPSF